MSQTSLDIARGPGRLRILQGDLTLENADAIVNAANPGLAGGGGVDGAIHRAAGHRDLQGACQEAIARRGGPLRPGEAEITPGFRLTARYVIHAVGPIWRGGEQGEPEALVRAYAACLGLARDHSLAIVAFPAISCGAYGFPTDLAAPLALRTLLAGLEQGLVQEARMVLRGETAFSRWLEAAERLR